MGEKVITPNFCSIFHINYFNYIPHQSYFSIIQKKFLRDGEGSGNFKNVWKNKVPKNIHSYFPKECMFSKF
jgi:hypothetical protein